MNRRDLISNVNVTTHVIAAAKTATNTPANGIDLQGYKSCLLIAILGAITNIGASVAPSWAFSLEHSDTINSGFVAVTADDVILDNGKNDGTITAGVYATADASNEDETAYTIEYIGGKRFIRVVATAANTPGSTPLSVIAIRAFPDRAPVADAG